MIDLKAQRAAAVAALAAADAALTEDDKAEQVERDEIASLREHALTKATAKRDIELARRLDAAVEKAGDPRAVKAVTVKRFSDTFIIERNGKAHAGWDRGCVAAQSTDKHRRVDMADVRRKYAVDSVIDWNGRTDFDVTPTKNLGAELDKFLALNPGVATSIVAAAVEINGALVEERKS